MAQFYFHVWRGGHLTPDEVGVALPSLTAAQGQAERLASSIRDQYEGAPADLSGWVIEGAPQAQERKVRDELTDRAQAA